MHRVVVTGIGTISSLGIGHQEFWQNLREGKRGIQRVTRFDPGGFACQVAGEVPAFKLADFIPKDYRKTAKLLSRDSELAIVAAAEALVDAGLAESRTTPAGPLGKRFGCHIGAGLITPDLNELSSAMAMANVDMSLDIRRWGAQAMNALSPLWMLKYLPNMLASHITIIHGIHGSSNTITCGEASGHLAIGEAMRAIQRGALDGAICGGIESKVNLMGFARQALLGRLAPVREVNRDEEIPLSEESQPGTILGEGGGLLVLEEMESAKKRGARIYAELVGFGARQDSRGPNPGQLSEQGFETAIRRALANANMLPDQIDLIIPNASGVLLEDQAESKALDKIFVAGQQPPTTARIKSRVGNLSAGNSLEAAVAALSLRAGFPQWNSTLQYATSTVKPDAPEKPPSPSAALSISGSLGGQYAVLLFRR